MGFQGARRSMTRVGGIGPRIPGAFFCALPLLTLSCLLVFAGSVRADDAGLIVATVDVSPAPYTLTLPDKVGVLEAASSLELSFEVSGRVERILGQGARVAEGELVAELDTDLEKAEVRRTSLLLDDALSELRRVRGLKQSSAASQSTLDSAVTAVGLRRAERDAARERLSRRTLRARYPGVIADVDIEPGEVTVPGRPIARLLNFDTMKIEVGMPGRQVGRVAVESRVHLRVPALPGEVFEGRVHHVAPSAANGGALFEVEIHVPNLDGRLKAGMGARVSIVTRVVPDALAIPVQISVLREGERVVFFVDVDGLARSIDVSEAVLHGDVLVVEGQPEPVRLVVRGQHDLRDGVAVQVDGAVLEGNGAPVTGPTVEVIGR